MAQDGNVDGRRHNAPAAPIDFPLPRLPLLSRLFDAAVEILLRAPAQLIFQPGRVDRVARVMARSIGHIFDERGARRASGAKLVEHRADPVHHVDILAFVAATDIVGFARRPLFDDEVERAGMIVDVEPVADILALANRPAACALRAR